MNNIIIISIYDSCVGWSIFIDGFIIDREELLYPYHRYPKGLRKLAKEVYNTCSYMSYTNEFNKYLIDKFSKYEKIIVVEDGGIEVIK